MALLAENAMKKQLRSRIRWLPSRRDLSSALFVDVKRLMLVDATSGGIELSFRGNVKNSVSFELGVFDLTVG